VFTICKVCESRERDAYMMCNAWACDAVVGPREYGNVMWLKTYKMLYDALAYDVLLNSSSIKDMSY